MSYRKSWWNMGKATLYICDRCGEESRGTKMTQRDLPTGESNCGQWWDLCMVCEKEYAGMQRAFVVGKSLPQSANTAPNPIGMPGQAIQYNPLAQGQQNVFQGLGQAGSVLGGIIGSGKGPFGTP